MGLAHHTSPHYFGAVGVEGRGATSIPSAILRSARVVLDLSPVPWPTLMLALTVVTWKTYLPLARLSLVATVVMVSIAFGSGLTASSNHLCLSNLVPPCFIMMLRSCSHLMQLVPHSSSCPQALVVPPLLVRG